MKKIDTYTAKGTKKEGVNLPYDLSGDANMVLLAQAIRVYGDRKHPGTSKTKTRAEVIASTRKIYRQKGTGLARHGAKSAPIFVGGGKAHGPDGLKRELKMPKKMRRKALNFSLSLKVKKGRIIVVEGLGNLKKTKEAQGLIDKIRKDRKLKSNVRFTFMLSNKNKDSYLALRNIENILIFPYSQLNAHMVYFGGLIVIDGEALKEINVNKDTKEDKKETTKSKKNNSNKITRKSTKK